MALFVPWLRDRLSMRSLRRLWRPRQETWKQLYGAGHLGSDEYLPLFEASELLLSRRQPAWMARFASRVARGLALGFLLGGLLALVIASAPTTVTQHCDTPVCQAVLATSAGVGLVFLAVGVLLFLA